MASSLFFGHFSLLALGGLGRRLLDSNFWPLFTNSLGNHLPLGTLAGLETNFLDGFLLASRRTFLLGNFLWSFDRNLFVQ